MATTRSFSDMLNEYLPLELLKEEFIKRDWLMSSVNMDESWKGGQLIVPFEGQAASSIEFGALAASNDIAEYDYVRGTISTQPEVWGSLIFNHRDLMEHDGKIPESTFLRILPGQVDGFLSLMKQSVSIHLLSGPHFAKVTTDASPTDAANGILAVDKIDRFQLSQKVSLDDDNSAAASYYVIAINVNDKTVTLSATRGGAAANVSAYTFAQNAKFYHPGAQTAGMTSLRSQLLSSANGGASSIFGQTKTAYPFLQCPNVSGASVTATNILDKIFDAYTQRQQLAKGGKAPTVVMSYKHLGSILKLIQVEKGPYNVVPNSRKASLYGWDEIEVGSVSSQSLKLVGITEMDDDIIYFLDTDSITFFSNGMFKRRKAPDGKEYYETRATSGYTYILDHCLFGDLVCHAPWKNLVLHSIPNY
jgi:hypothetical protein